MTSDRGIKNRGFTLIELLVVIVIIGVLFGILLPAMLRSRRNAIRQRAISECGALTAAVSAYRHAYQRWPSDLTSGTNIYVNDNYVILEYMEANNPRGITFLNWSDFRTNSAGTVVDQYQYPYILTLNMDWDTVSVATNPASHL